MHFTISAAGTKEQVLESLESQREEKPDYGSLKNQVLEHIAGHVQGFPETASSISVTASVGVSYSVATAQSDGEPA
jgi:hypothetical protein